VITLYVLISALAAFVAALVAFVAWRRRAAPGGRPLVGLMIAIAFWSAGAAFEYAAIGIPNKVFWAKVQYLGVVTVPVLYLLLAIEYGHHEHWLTHRRIALLFVVPFITLLLAVTNDWHGLVWPAIVPTTEPADNLAVYSHGLGFWIGSVGYGYLLMAIATGIFILAALRFPPIYRRQAALLIAAALAPWLVNIIYILGLSPVPGLEPTPLVLVFTGAVFVWGLLRLRLLDLAPVARATLVETMADGVVVLDVFDRIVDINPAAQRFLGTGTPIPFGQPAGTAFAGWLDWPASFGAARDAHLELTLPEPSPCTLELSIAPIHDRRGQFSGRLLTIHDITARKDAQTQIELLNSELEARVVKRTQDLAASEERFRQVVTSISDHVFALHIDAGGNTTTLYSSPRLADLTGYSPEALDADFVQAMTRMTHPDDRADVLAAIPYLIEQDAGEIEYRLIRADGTITWVRTSVRVQRGESDKIVYGVTGDITERKEMETIAAEARALAELDRLRTELVSNVSHELRTPLGLIKVASTTLQRQDVTFPPTVQQQILGGITTEADRLEHLVSNLLDISRLDHQRFFLRCAPTDLNHLVSVTVEAMRIQTVDAATERHHVVLDLSEPAIVPVVDGSKIEQVLRNLLENAANYSPAGSTIAVGLRCEGDAWELRVADEGIGIAQEDQEHIFERFYRARDARVTRIRGAGLGLAICQEIVAAHGGTLRVESRLNHGTTFVMRLPLLPAAADDIVG